MLRKVEKHPDDLVPINIVVTDFSGTSTPAKGLVTLTVKVGSSERHSVFVVVPSKASYNALLGRDWIHGVGVVPSTVHQSVLLWIKNGKPKIVKVDSNLYVEQLHADFRMYNRKLKPLNVDRSLNPYNCEGCYLYSKGLSVKLRYPKVENKVDSSDEVGSQRVSNLSRCDNIDSMSSVEFSYKFTVSCNGNNNASRTADLIAEAHCVENQKSLRFEKYSVKDDDYYRGWVSNIVPVIKKNGKLRVCTDFRDLNNATLKDEYFMPIANMLIDSAAGNEILSFMDGYLGYNQIFIAEDDVSKTVFRCPGAIASENTIGCMLAQDDENGHERAVYYLSRVLMDIETRVFYVLISELWDLEEVMFNGF
ncbi:uncharacterized protein LOC130979169 [Arachis stenosperma]|uniref:uncharacterized protein LOC130979169 n=1 Tax=Arachis stenosperma TaxID=217475 RepID=UPI0025ABE9F9|nr:uncharacterized protein LOC130979169 [Arachis stenosperma]